MQAVGLGKLPLQMRAGMHMINGKDTFNNKYIIKEIP